MAGLFKKAQMQGAVEQPVQEQPAPEQQEVEIPVADEETGQVIMVSPEELVSAIDEAVNNGEMTEEEAMELVEEVEKMLQLHFAKYMHPGNGEELPEGVKMATILPSEEDLIKIAEEKKDKVKVVLVPTVKVAGIIEEDK